MNDTAFCFFSASLFLFFSSVHDLKIKKDFYMHAKEDYQKVIYNIDNEIKMEKGIHEDIMLICNSGCRDDLETSFNIIQFTFKSRKVPIFMSSGYMIHYSYNRQ